jgi:hypothetical protein
MTTTAIPTHPRGRGRIATGIVAAAAGALIGVVGTTTFINRQASDVQPVGQLQPVPTLLPLSADAAERRFTPAVDQTAIECRPDAAERWQVPQIAVADLPYTADAAEHWLTPEIAVADLPFTADAAEHWLCAAP